jgi:hypothetical protein
MFAGTHYVAQERRGDETNGQTMRQFQRKRPKRHMQIELRVASEMLFKFPD